MPHVKIFTTQYCPFCVRAKALLRERGVDDFEEIKIDETPAERATMVQLSGRRTVPQIFIGDKHVGGCDDLQALDRRGELASLLAA
jgi:glutaredoxin 3